MPRIQFTVPFVKGKERPRANFKAHRMYTPASTLRAEAEIWAAYAAACAEMGCDSPLKAPIDKQVDVYVAAYMPAPASTPKGARTVPYTVKPDIDNVLKLVLDGLNPKRGERTGAWHDDAQVTQAIAQKSDRLAIEREHTFIVVQWLADDEEVADGTRD